MKYLKNIFFILLAVIAFSACETYGDYDIDYTPIHPLGGQYRIHVLNQAGDTLLRDYCYIANTTDYATDKCWIRIGNYNANPENEWAINGKISCDISSLTFSGSSIENLAGNVPSSTETFSVSDGMVVLDGMTTEISKTTTDKISFSFTNSRYPGQIFKADGYRYTGWGGD